MSEITLYGTPLSLYTGKARSYLIKAGLAYRELTPTSEHARSHVQPRAGSKTIPVIETAEGDVIRDGTAIIDHYEGLSDYTFSPSTPKQRIVSRLFDVIGAEGLLRPAMHYRWNFPELNANFLTFHFETMIPPEMDRKALAESTMDRMRNAGQAFGAVPESFDAIESLYEVLLEKFNEHFGLYPYLLGGRPCIGDFGLIAPLYAHLGRDPAPLRLMQLKAVRLFRWVERMNRPESDVGEFDGVTETYLADDEIPPTLIELMKHLAIDFVPETTAAAGCINDWLDAQPELSSGTPIERAVGTASFELKGQTISAIAQPYRFYLLARVQEEYERLTQDEKTDVHNMLVNGGMETLLNTRLTRQIGRAKNLEVWV